MNERYNQQFIQSLTHFEKGITSEILEQFVSFVCKAYKFPRSTKKINENEIYDHSSTCYHHFLKSNAECKKLPPSIFPTKYMEFCSFVRH